MRDARDYAAELDGVEAGSATEQSIRNDQAKRAEEAKTVTLSLQSLADQIGEDDRNGARALNVVFGNAEISAPLSSSFSAGQASRDVQAIMSGTATPDQKERFYRATSLTPEQRAALARGEDAVIPKEQFDYLKGIYTPNWGQSADGAAPYSLDALKHFGDEYSGTERDALKQGLADGVFLLGNPQLRTDQTYSNAVTEIYAGAQWIFVSGGISQVPQPIRDVLTSPAASKCNVSATDGGTHSGGHRSVTDLKTLGGLKTVMDILEHRSVDANGSVCGSESVQLGSDVDRALVARAGEIAAAGRGEYVSNPGYFDHNDVSKADTEGLLTRMLDVAGGDHIAVHDAVMSATGGTSAGSMPSVYDLDGNERSFKDAEMLKHLFTYDWTDGAGHGEDGINKLFNWMPEVAYATDGSSVDAIADSTRAGNIATALGEYFGDNKDALTDIGDEKMALGELNPELVGTLASAIGPHTAAMGGADAALFGSHGVSEISVEDLKATFQVLNSDAEAGKIVNSLTSLQVDRLQEEFGRNPTLFTLGEVAGRLEGAMAGGLEAHIDETEIDGRYVASRDAAVGGALFDSGEALIAAVPGLKPALMSLLSGAAPDLKLALFGLPVDPDSVEIGGGHQDVRAELYDEQMRPNAKYVQVLEGYFSAHPELADTPEFRGLFAADTNFEAMKQAGAMGSVVDERKAANFIINILKAEMGSFDGVYNSNYTNAYQR